MGARLKLQERAVRDRRGGTANLAVDVQRDGRGEFFEIRVRPMVDVRLEVVDVQPAERHLLLLAEEGNQKLKFLCGHDERQWFVAAVPDQAATVSTAREALKPAEVRQAQARRQIKTEDRKRRKTDAYVRQGGGSSFPPRTCGWKNGSSCTTSRSPRRRQQAAQRGVLLPLRRPDGLRLQPASRRSG